MGSERKLGRDTQAHFQAHFQENGANVLRPAVSGMDRQNHGHDVDTDQEKSVLRSMQVVQGEMRLERPNIEMQTVRAQKNRLHISQRRCSASSCFVDLES